MSQAGSNPTERGNSSLRQSGPSSAPPRACITYQQKHAQANREALATVAALGVTIIVWIVCGFGLSGLDVTVFHTPLWVLGGTLGTWACAIIASIVLAKRFFADFSLDDENASVCPEKQAAPDAPPVQLAASTGTQHSDGKESGHE